MIDRAWWRRSVGARMLAATLTVGSATLLVRLAAFARELVIAREFGVGSSMDAFFLAFMVPTFVVGVVSGSLNAALIPTYLRVRDEEGHEAAQRLFSSVTFATTALLAAAAAVMAIVFPLIVPLIATDFGPDEVTLTRNLFLLLLPTIVLTGMSTMWAAVLNAGERFA